MIRRLVEVAPGKWRLISRQQLKAKRSSLPLPYIISDTMDPVEQVDGKFYTSKSQFRAVGKSLGLIEVGNEKQTNKVQRASTSHDAARSVIERLERRWNKYGHADHTGENKCQARAPSRNARWRAAAHDKGFARRWAFRKRWQASSTAPTRRRRRNAEM